jgi:hypothetical protein
MFHLFTPLLAPDDDPGAAPLAPPIDSQPDDHVDEGWQETAQDAPQAATDHAGSEPVDEPESPLDAVQKALDKAGAESAQDKPAEDAKPATEAGAQDKKLDELYQIPRGLNGEARAKFKALSDHARALDTQFSEVRQEADTVKQRLTGFEEIIRDSGANGQVLAQHFGYIKAINSGDYEGALAFIEAERQALARALGRPLDGVDLLADFPDLRQRVDGLELDEQTALELANARRAQTQQQEQARHADVARQQQMQQQQVMQERQQVIAAIGQWTQEMQSKDIDFAAKDALVQRYLSKPTTQQILSKLPPHLWLDHIQTYYDELQVTAPQPAAARTPQPLRPKGAGGQVVKTAATPLDAVKQALGAR